MSTNRIDNSRATVTVEPARQRQTAPPATPFREILAGGVGALVTGAEVATGVIGGPVLAAAVHSAGSGIVQTLAGGPPGDGPAGGGGGGAAAGLSPELAQMHAMQRQSQAFNMQLLHLQQDVQDENRRFSTLTNVLRAKHDTAKAAVGNIRS
jgi:hypothetical protein